MEVQAWLRDKGLEEHASKFQEHGWDDISLLQEMTDDDIEMCIKKRGHRVKFKKERVSLISNTDHECHARKKSNKEQLRIGDCPMPVSVIYNREDYMKANMTTKNNAMPLISSSSVVNTVISENSVTANEPIIDTILQNCSLDDPVESKSIESRLKQTKKDYQVPTEIESHGECVEMSTFESDIALYEEYNGESSKNETFASLDGAGLDIENFETVNDGDTSTVYEAERHNQPLAIISNDGCLATGTIGDCPKGGSDINLTIIKHSAHTTVGDISAELDTTNSVKNLKDQMQMEADSYKMKDHLYLETEAYKELESVLEVEHWATLLGKPGDGKSTTAAHLLLKYRDKGFEPIFATFPRDWKMLISKHSGKQIVVIDDMFGSMCVEDRKVEDWLPEMEHMEKIVKERKGKLCVVCTSRKYIYKDVEPKVAKFSCFQKISTIDMTDKMYQLTGVEKVAMLKKYAEEYDIDIKDIINGIYHADPPHGFPHCVKMYCTNEFLMKNGIAFFKNPAKYVQRELLNFRDNSGITFLSLVLVLFNNNNLNASYIDTLQDNATDDEKKLFKATGVPLETGSPGIRKALYGLTNTYLKRDTNGSYSFTHHSLCENVAIMYIRTNATHAIQLLDFQHIMCFINIQEDFTNNVNAGYGIDAIEQLPLQHLARRISFEIQNGNVSTVCSCRIWRNQSFVNQWLKYVECQPFKIAEAIVCAQEKWNKVFLACLIDNEWKNAVQGLLASQILKLTLKESTKMRFHVHEVLSMAVRRLNFDEFAHLIKTLNSHEFERSGQICDGSAALMTCLGFNTPEYALILIKETSICPGYSRFSYGYFDSLVKSNMRFEDFKKISGLLLHLGININDDDYRGRSPIFSCVFQAPICTSTSERLDWLIKHGANINTISDFGNIFAYTIKYFQFHRHRGICSRRVIPKWFEMEAEILSKLLKLGADFQNIDNHGSNALHALFQSHQDLLNHRPRLLYLLDYLLSLGISCSQCNDKGEVPLMLALWRDPGVDVIQTLVSHSPPNHRNSHGQGYLHYLCASEYISSDRFYKYCEIVLPSIENINQTDASGNPPIVSLMLNRHFHCSNRQIEICNFLSGKQLDLISARDDKGRNIVLTVLENTKRNETLLPLLQLFYSTIGLDFHQTDKDGRNALHYAFIQKITLQTSQTNYDENSYESYRIWTVSLEEDAIVGDVYTFLTNTVGLDPHLSDRKGVNPVMLAFQNCAECSCIQALLETDIPVQRDFQGETYIHYLKRSRASENRFKFLMLYLLEKHIDTDEIDFCGRIPHIEYINW